MLSMLLASNAATRYLKFYQNYLLQKWDALTPMQYGTVLISIGVVGWLLMRGANRR